ncbi:helicase associated domain-containing protein [Streptomyces exfoliatus]|uniref:helicase associated domain-containing protein n=1 Tax=Streptomyces exfoliatus TaxID=1905 RepID=UPI00324EFF58
MTVKLGAWISNTESRRGRLDAEQLTALRELGMDWAKPVTVPQPTPDTPLTAYQHRDRTPDSPPPALAQNNRRVRADQDT